jgi:hypothetical protein
METKKTKILLFDIPTRISLGTINKDITTVKVYVPFRSRFGPNLALSGQHVELCVKHWKECCPNAKTLELDAGALGMDFSCNKWLLAFLDALKNQEVEVKNLHLGEGILPHGCNLFEHVGSCLPGVEELSIMFDKCTNNYYFWPKGGRSWDFYYNENNEKSGHTDMPSEPGKMFQSLERYINGPSSVLKTLIIEGDGQFRYVEESGFIKHMKGARPSPIENLVLKITRPDPLFLFSFSHRLPDFEAILALDLFNNVRSIELDSFWQMRGNVIGAGGAWFPLVSAVRRRAQKLEVIVIKHPANLVIDYMDTLPTDRDSDKKTYRFLNEYVEWTLVGAKTYDAAAEIIPFVEQWLREEPNSWAWRVQTVQAAPKLQENLTGKSERSTIIMARVGGVNEALFGGLFFKQVTAFLNPSHSFPGKKLVSCCFCFPRCCCCCWL